jgi:hypothetical protein
MEDWKYYDTFSGTPQGGIISPLLANIYLNELDKFVENTMIPAYTEGKRRSANPAYANIGRQIEAARNRGDLVEVKRLKCERRKMPSTILTEPDYRRLRYIRYADDFLLGFVGPKKEADDIRQQISEFLEQQLKLTLSVDKTLITHAGNESAKFLGHEIKAIRAGDLIANDGRRAANGAIALLMPRKVVSKYLSLYSRRGKITHRNELKHETDYTIIQRYQSVLRGIYNFYCMTNNVSRRMGYINNILMTSLLKTLASKYKSKVNRMVKKYQIATTEGKKLQTTLRRSGKEPLTATYGGLPFKRIPRGQGAVDVTHWQLWHKPATKRSEVVQRLLVGKCELCGLEGPTEVHHIRKLADIDRVGRRPKADWEKVMAARRRKTLVVCQECHDDIHAGRYDGRSFKKGSLESRML